MGLSREKINYMIFRFYDIMTPDITYEEIIKIEKKVDKEEDPNDRLNFYLKFPNIN